MSKETLSDKRKSLLSEAYGIKRLLIRENVLLFLNKVETQEKQFIKDLRWELRCENCTGIACNGCRIVKEIDEIILKLAGPDLL